MHFRSGLAIVLVALSAVMVACGGGSHSALPGGSSAGTLRPQLNGGSVGSPAPTLYVSAMGGVWAYALPIPSGTTTTPPISLDSGFYYSAGGLNTQIGGIATNPAGDLAVVQNYGNGDPAGTSCQLVLIPARTSGRASFSAISGQCSNNGGTNYLTGQAVGVTYTGGPSPSPNAGFIDVLMHYTPETAPSPTPGCGGATTAQYEVDRYTVAGSVTNTECFALNMPPSAETYKSIAGDVNAGVFVDYNGTGATPPPDAIQHYSGAPGTPAPDATGLVFGGGAAGQLGVSSADGNNHSTYRVVAIKTGAQTALYTFQVTGASMTFGNYLCCFGQEVAGVAADNLGNTYVAINQATGNGGVPTKIKVYASGNFNASAPNAFLQNPIRRPDPNSSPVARINGMAIADGR